MGMKDFLEEAAGAVVAEQAVDKLDPNAGLLEKGAAALAGFEGVNLIKEHFDGGVQPQAAAPAADPATTDGSETNAPVDQTADTTSQDDSQNS